MKGTCMDFFRFCLNFVSSYTQYVHEKPMCTEYITNIWAVLIPDIAKLEKDLWPSTHMPQCGGR
jgi:hypothetical protein